MNYPFGLLPDKRLALLHGYGKMNRQLSELERANSETLSNELFIQFELVYTGLGRK
jgi:hypothetical protein